MKKDGKAEEVGTAGDVAKLNGELLESNNKLRLFKTVAGAEGLTYAQATRWLISLIAYDDTSAKATKDLPEGQKYPSPGVGWLGRLGYIQAQGKTLFETLLLNLTLLKDGKTLWGGAALPEDAYLSLPCWELDRPRDRERTEVPLPKTFAALYTVQSLGIDPSSGQEVYLKRNGEKTFVWDALDKVPVGDTEPKSGCHVTPASTSVPADKEGEHRPGVVSWVATLHNQKCLDQETLVHFAVCAMGYGDKYFFVKDTFEDGLAFHAALLDATGDVRERIVAEIELCEQAARAVGNLARDLAAAAGGEADGASARDQFYFRVDRPFRQWLEALDPAGDVGKAIDEWRETVQDLAVALGNELALAAGPAAFVGRAGKRGHLSTPEALRLFRGAIRKIYTKGA